MERYTIWVGHCVYRYRTDRFIVFVFGCLFSFLTISISSQHSTLKSYYFSVFIWPLRKWHPTSFETLKAEDYLEFMVLFGGIPSHTNLFREAY